MPNASQPSLRDRNARSRLRQILLGPALLRATWVLLRRPCGRTGCRCARSKKQWHRTWYISQRRRGKLRRKSIPSELHEDVDRWLKDYWEARTLLDQISDEHWARLEKRRK
jgi:hypothetical protein